jgi:NADPH:quinone reductase-like Zn-dependent oxidoreductase
LFSLLAQSKIEPVIARRMPLIEAARAHELVEQAAVQSKIVLVINSPL